MENSIFSKTYAGFSIGYCVLMTLIAVMTIVVPIYDYGFTPLNDEGQFLYHTIIAVLTLLVFTPQPIALMSFYFSGGIGKNWFSHIVFMALVLSFSSLVLLVLYLIYLQMAGIPAFYFENIKSQPLEKFAVLFLILAFLHSLFFPFLFAITAFVVQKVSLGKRFLPIISMVSAIFLAIVFAVLIVVIGKITGIQSIYNGSREATYPHWFMLGSIAWTLIGLSAFWKTKEVVLSINPIHQELQIPVIATFNSPTDEQKSNKKPYLILIGIGAIVLIGVFSIVAAAFGLIYLSRPKTTFEGKSNTNQAQSNTNSNPQNTPKTEDLLTLVESRKNLFGDFKLYQINKSDTKFYPYPKDKINASFYSEQDPKKLTFFDVSVFNNVDDARKEVEFRKKYIGEQKLKILSEKNNADGVSISLKNKEYFEIIECQGEVCFSVRDKTESVTSMFRLWIFKQIVPEAKKIAKNN